MDRIDQYVAAGADGYRGKWVVAAESVSGSTSLHIFPDLRSLISWGRDLKALVLDVPIGLLNEGRRACDVAARRIIGQRRNSVFSAPIRPLLVASSWEEACAIRTAVEQKRCSKQVFGILPLVRAADEAMHPELQHWIREGHPEVSFTILSGAPMTCHKSKHEGTSERLAVLEPEFPDLHARIREFGRPGALTDVIDAYVLLWTARRVRSGISIRLPDAPDIDARGLRAEIVA